MTSVTTDPRELSEQERKAWLFDALTKVAGTRLRRSVELDPDSPTFVQDIPGPYDDIWGTFRLRQDGYELDALAYLIAYHFLRRKHGDTADESLIAREAMHASRLVLRSFDLDLGLSEPAKGPLRQRWTLRRESRWAAGEIIAAINHPQPY